MWREIGSKRFFRRFVAGIASLAALSIVTAQCAYADPPPIGYTGPVPYTPPIGYTGVVPRPKSASAEPVPVDAAPAPATPQIPAAQVEAAPSVTAPPPVTETKTAKLDTGKAWTPPLGYVGVVPRPGPTKDRSAAREHAQETLITANRMSFDQINNIATAAGNVEIAHGGYVLHADQVTYNQNTSVMKAEGHIAMLHPDGVVSFASEEEITGDMKDAYIKNLGVLFPDNSRLAALSAQRYQGRYLVADKAVYTACNVCKKNPDNPPLWQMRANEVVHDNVTHNIYYHDATLDLAGVPVLYTPYFSTPDPTVERRQGFLAPTPGSTPNAGYFLHVPYYFDIAPDKDATFAPTFSTNDIAMLGGEYRERWAHGRLTLDGNATYAQLLSENTGVSKGDRMRGDLMGDFVYDINNVWRAGSTVNYVSDKSFLERYNLGSPASTLSRAYVEGFSGRNYASVTSYYFQNLQPGTQPVQPIIAPNATFSMMGEPGATLGGRWSLDGSMLITARDNNSTLPIVDQGPQTRRLSVSGGWDRRLTSDTGLVTDINALVRADGYWADNVPDPNSNRVYNHVVIGRQFEQANITESYPLARHGDGYQQILEPIVMLTAAPVVRLDPTQPIEDSFNVQFDETSLFDPNRFTGTDLIEGGNRATYGVRQSFIADGGAHFDVFGGQSYDFTRNGEFPELSGLHDHSSDYVGRISASPGSWLDMDYGFRYSHRDLSPEAQDAHISFGTPLFRPSLRYLLAYQTETTGVVGTTEELIPGFSSSFGKYWTLTASHIQAFQPDPGPRQTTVELDYTDECFIFGVSAQRNEISRFDIQPGTSILFHVMLKNIGGIHTDSFNSPQYNTQFRQTD